MKAKRVALCVAASGALVLIGLGVFVGCKVRDVARELTNPPFYHPQPLDRVNATYRDLAQGDADDPGGTWESQEVEGLQLWRIRRARPSTGVVILLHGFGDDRWGTSPALRYFPDLDAAIFTYLRRDDAMREGRQVPPVTFGARESENVVSIVHALEAQGTPRGRIILMGRSLGASVGLLALARLEREGKGPLAGLIWEGAPASSRDFSKNLVCGTEDRFWHPLLAPIIGECGSRWASHLGGYDRDATDIQKSLGAQRIQTPGLCFLATQDRLASPSAQREVARHFDRIQIIEVPTWHLHCAEILGPAYGKAIRQAAADWMR